MFDAIVVGYGPVGAVAAGLLGQAGLRTAVFEPTTSVYHLPRAAHIDAEIMRVLHVLGVADDVLPACAPVTGMHFINAAGDALLRFDALEGQGWMFYQPDLERALRAGVDRDPNVEVHLAHEVVAFDQRDDRVAVTVRDLVRNTEPVVSARFLLGGRGRGRHGAAGTHRRAARAVGRARRRRDRAGRRVRVPCGARNPVARPAGFPRWRRGPSDAALPRPGHVFRRPRCPQPRMEARSDPARACGARAPGHVRGRAQSARPVDHRGRGRIRRVTADHRSRSGGGTRRDDAES